MLFPIYRFLRLTLRIKLLLLFCCLSNFITSQTIYRDCTADAPIRIGTGGICVDWATTNYGSVTSAYIMKWTWNISPNNCTGWGRVRALYRFDLNILSDNQRLYDNRAFLHMYFTTGSTETQYAPNSFYVERITANWGENTVTWNNQPAVTTSNRITVPNSTSTTQNYVIDISSLAYDWICNGQLNYGVKMTQVNESSDSYQRVNFATKEHTTSALHPKLRLEYARIETSHAFCSGGNFLTLTTTLTNAQNPNLYNYSWVHNNSGTTYSGKDWLNPPFTSGATNTYTVTASNPWCQTATHSVTASAPVSGGTLTWTGTQNNDWFNPCNWNTLTVPTSANDVIVPGGTTYQPTVSGGTGYCNTLVVSTANGGMVYVNAQSGGHLQVNH